MGDLQHYICRRLARCPGCGIGTFVVNLDLDCGRSAYFVVFFVTLGLRWVFRVQTKLVAIIVIAAFVAEPWRLLDSVDLKPVQ
jgi:hypothetical protein